MARRVVIIVGLVAGLVFGIDLRGQGREVKKDIHDPANAVANLEVHKDLQATLFASEILAAGSGFVTSRIIAATTARRPEGDRILILEDKDGDGKADTVKTFYQGRGRRFRHGHLRARQQGDRLLLAERACLHLR
jgi:hypothetical protein